MKNAFVQKYIQENNLTVLQSDEEKPWGAYYVIKETPEYDKKILWLKPHALLSLQYHGNPTHPGHREEGEWLTDMALVLGKEDMTNKSLDSIYEKISTDVEVIRLRKWERFSTPAGVLHAYINPFDHDVYLLETRISQISEQASDREKNIIRIYDTTMRGGTPDWPEWLREKISKLS
jgi:Mannose-6-phosphate isomerase